MNAALAKLGDLPIAPLITSLAKGIAEAQLALDQVSMQVAVLMAGTEDANRVIFGERSYSLLELGFSPTFYHFTESIIEVKVSISMTVSSESKVRVQTKATEDRRASRFRYSAARSSSDVGHSSRVQQRLASVDASYSNKYQYSVDGSSRVKTRMVPAPPPEIFYDRVRELMEQERAYRDQLGKA